MIQRKIPWYATVQHMSNTEYTGSLIQNTLVCYSTPHAAMIQYSTQIQIQHIRSGGVFQHIMPSMTQQSQTIMGMVQGTHLEPVQGRLPCAVVNSFARLATVLTF